MDSIKEILSNVAPIPEYKFTKRHSYIVIGKPGSGKSTLSAKIAEITRSQLVSWDTCLSKIVENKESPLNQVLREGGVITTESLYNDFKAQLGNEVIHAKGFVLEGLPVNIKNPNLYDQMDHLLALVQKSNCVLVDLRIADQDLVRRRAASWLDPVTNISYPGQQVFYSRRRRREGWTDGEVDTVYNAERASPAAKDSAQSSTEEGGEEEEAPDGEGSANAQVPESAPKLFKNLTSYPILSEKILDRLIKLPENDPEKVAEELVSYKKVEEKLDDFRKRNFNPLQIVELDATQHPEQVFNQMYSKMEARGLSIYDALCPPFRLPPVDQTGATDAELFKNLSTLSLREGEPEREISPFKKYCPVSLSVEKKLVDGSHEFAAVYRGKVYLCSSEENVARFVTYPEKYLTTPLAIAPPTIAIIGYPPISEPFIGKSIAKKYDLGYINPEDVIVDWEANQWAVLQTDNQVLKEIAAKVYEQLKQGASVSSETYCQIVEHYINLYKSDQARKNDGWVLEGFPTNTEQAAFLTSNNLLPGYVFNIRCEFTETQISQTLSENLKLPCSRSSSVLHQKFCYLQDSSDSFLNSITDAMKELGDKPTKLETIQWKASPLALVTSILSKIDPFVPQAVALPKVMEPNNFVFGGTKDYCPVHAQSKRLVKGDSNIVGKFMGYTYYFASEEAKLSFFSQPYFYTKNSTIPPTRIAVLGASGSGKRTVLSILSKRYNVPIVDFVKFCSSTDFGTQINNDLKIALSQKTNIPTGSIKVVMSRLFTQEPFASQGWLLTGFPLTRSDIEPIIKARLVPDAFLVLQVVTEAAVKRKISSARQQQNRLENQRLEKLRKLPKLDPENPLNQTLLKTEEKLVEDLSLKVEQENMSLNDFVTALESWATTPVVKISTSKCFRPVMAEIEKELSTYLGNRESLFASATTIAEKQAQELIDFGIKSFSNIGKLCPVVLKETQKVNPKNFGSIPVVFGNQIYYLKSKKEEAEFIYNPSKYISQRPPPPILASNCCILGNPKSGKSALAELMSKELDAVHLTISSILQTILDGKEITIVAEKIRKALESGKALPDAAIVDAIVVITNRIAASGKGWILDGFPYTTEQAFLLEKVNFQPHYFFNLVLDNENEIIKRAKQDQSTPVALGLPGLNASDVILNRNLEWKKSLQFTKNLYQHKYSNWIDLDANRSKWSLKEEVVKYCDDALARRQIYLERKTTGKAAPCSDIGISIPFMLKQRSLFEAYCPFELVDNQILCTETNNFIAEYRDRFYYLSSKTALDALLESPEKYAQHKLPTVLPKQSSKSELVFPKQLELRGYCPVTFEQGPAGFNSIIPGSLDFIAEYNSQFYSFASEQHLKKFMARPWMYSNLKLPTKLPPPVAPIPVNGLPITGYLEQCVSSTLTTALLEVGKFRPKHPYKSVDQSASEFLALYLKANNQKSKDWIKKSHGRKLAKYMTNCELMKELTQSISKDSTMTPDLESNIDQFLKLKK